MRVLRREQFAWNWNVRMDMVEISKGYNAGAWLGGVLLEHPVYGAKCLTCCHDMHRLTGIAGGSREPGKECLPATSVCHRSLSRSA